MLSPAVVRDRLARVLGDPPAVTREPGSVPAAVLVPVLLASGEPRLVLTRRTETLPRHAGEISFPGGLLDPGEDPAAGALREANEELGIAPEDVETLGCLPPIHTRVTGMLIVPVVGLLWQDPRFTANGEEIAEILEFPLAELAAQRREQELTHEGRAFTTEVFDMEGNVIWGATGRILGSFLDALAAGEET